MKRHIAVAVILFFTVRGASAATEPNNRADILEPARAAFAAAEETLRNEAELKGEQSDFKSVRRYADLLLETGQQVKALELLEAAKTPDADAELKIAEILLTIHRYPEAGALIEEVNRRYPENERARELEYRWWALRNDLERIDGMLAARSKAGSLTFEDRLASASLQLRMLNYAGAYAAYSELVTPGLSPLERSRVTRGVGVALYHLQRYDESLRKLQEALGLDPLNVDTITAIADTLLRLGRVDDAVAAYKFALQISPWNERAHQSLGNGFTRQSYAQLLAAFPSRFADEQGRAALAKGDAALEGRRVSKARGLYQAVANSHRGWADAEVRLGSLEYSERNFAAAREHFWKALSLCADYGRAHNGFAISVGALRLQLDPHHEEDEKAFSAAAMPVIPNIERYVLNWGALSPRQQKRLALSIEPWRRYIPALELAGATLYVKPAYQLLSQAPYQHLLKDRRIDYDSRLWDDVRGAGGFHTVVGVEDVETRVDNGYDTMLHEMSHQVHQILSSEWTRQIQALYAETTRRQVKSGDAFLSQYSASSVWEYFAEGANSLHNPRRDRYDSREIVLERLEARDPSLLALTREIMDQADVGPSFAAALIRLGDSRLSEGKPQAAEAAYRKALRRAPNDERALVAVIRALTIEGKGREAQALAATAYDRHRMSASIAVERAYVDWLEGLEGAKSISFLTTARAEVRPEEQYLADLQIGRLSANIGDIQSAKDAFGKVLAYQPDNPEALAGLAAAEASAGDWANAWKRYEQAVQIRSGSAAFHAMYARDLIRAGELSRAQKQIETGLLLDPEDPEVLAMQAWSLLVAGQSGNARQIALRALQLDPWSAPAAIVAAAAERRSGNLAAAEKIMKPLDERLNGSIRPQFIYRHQGGHYELVYTLSAGDRELLKEIGAAGN